MIFISTWTYPFKGMGRKKKGNKNVKYIKTVTVRKKMGGENNLIVKIV